MPPRLDRWIRRLWNGEAGMPGRAVSLALLPLELVYRGGVAVRNVAYDRGWMYVTPAPLPVISVGNLLVGGTGKTPVSAWIARFLAERGTCPGLVARGYGEDELGLHRRWNPEVPVLADPERARAAREAARRGLGCVVLDDGFQHRALARDLDLVLLPVEGPPSGPLLPRGPRREPLSALARADWAVLVRRTGSSERAERREELLRARFPGLGLARIHLVVDGWATLEGEDAPAPSGPVLALTGIARPRAFADMVERRTGAPVELEAFPDHHDFTAGELRRVRERAGARTVVTTEKDAVRLLEADRVLGDARVLRLRVEPESGVERLFRDLLRVASRDEART